MQLFFKNLFYNSYHDIGWSVYDNWSNTLPQNSILTFGLNTNSGWNLERTKKELQENNEPIMVYNAEPLNPEWHISKDLIENMRGFDFIWDYNIKNIPILRDVGIEAKYRPTLYTERLKRINNSEEPEIDILFYGSMSAKRTKFINDFYAYAQIDKTILNKIAKNNPSISESEFLVWEKAVERLQTISFSWVLGHFTIDSLDKVLSRSKIVLDLTKEDWSTHRNSSRIFYPLINNKCVLAEYHDDRDLFDGCIAEYKDENDFTRLIFELIVEDGWREYSNSGERFRKNSLEVKDKILNEGL